MLLFFFACSAPPQAPENLEELCKYIFARVDTTQEAELQMGLMNLDDWLLTDDNLEETSQGYQVFPIEQEAVNNLDDVERIIGEKQMGAAVAFEHNFDIFDVAVASFIEYWPTVSGSDYEVYEREFSEDASCILEKSCTWIEYDNYSISSWAGIVTVESDLHGQVRWVPTEYGDMLVQRTWMKVPAIITPESLGLRVDAQYFVSVILPNNGSAIRANATWIETEYGALPVSEDWAKSQIVSTMVGQEEAIETWLADGGTYSGGEINTSEELEQSSCAYITFKDLSLYAFAFLPLLLLSRRECSKRIAM